MLYEKNLPKARNHAQACRSVILGTQVSIYAKTCLIVMCKFYLEIRFDVEILLQSRARMESVLNIPGPHAGRESAFLLFFPAFIVLA